MATVGRAPRQFTDLFVQNNSIAVAHLRADAKHLREKGECVGIALRVTELLNEFLRHQDNNKLQLDDTGRPQLMVCDASGAPDHLIPAPLPEDLVAKYYPTSPRSPSTPPAKASSPQARSEEPPKSTSSSVEVNKRNCRKILKDAVNSPIAQTSAKVVKHTGQFAIATLPLWLVFHTTYPGGIPSAVVDLTKALANLAVGDGEIIFHEEL